MNTNANESKTKFSLSVPGHFKSPFREEKSGSIKTCLYEKTKEIHEYKQ